MHTVLQLKTEGGLVRLVDVNLQDGGTARDVMAQLELEYPESALLVVINGRLAHLDHVLHDADELHLMPSISGG